MNSIIVAALCCGAISFTITTTSIFASLRAFVSKWGKTWEGFIHCPWCFGHWVCLVYLLFTQGSIFDLVGANDVVDFFVNWFTICGAMGIVHYLLLKAYNPVAKSEFLRKTQKND